MSTFRAALAGLLAVALVGVAPPLAANPETDARFGESVEVVAVRDELSREISFVSTSVSLPIE